MAQIVDSVMVCEDCLQAIAYDDYSGLDLRSEEYSERRMPEIQHGIWDLVFPTGDDNTPPRHLAVGDMRDDFSTSACGCCSDRHAGERHEINILS